jgi:hypothetical protein
VHVFPRYAGDRLYGSAPRCPPLGEVVGIAAALRTRWRAT